MREDGRERSDLRFKINMIIIFEEEVKIIGTD